MNKKYVTSDEEVDSFVEMALLFQLIKYKLTEEEKIRILSECRKEHYPKSYPCVFLIHFEPVMTNFRGSELKILAQSVYIKDFQNVTISPPVAIPPPPTPPADRDLTEGGL